jgi:hypothetical protein
MYARDEASCMGKSTYEPDNRDTITETMIQLAAGGENTGRARVVLLDTDEQLPIVCAWFDIKVSCQEAPRFVVPHRGGTPRGWLVSFMHLLLTPLFSRTTSGIREPKRYIARNVRDVASSLPPDSVSTYTLRRSTGTRWR